MCPLVFPSPLLLVSLLSPPPRRRRRRRRHELHYLLFAVYLFLTFYRYSPLIHNPELFGAISRHIYKVAKRKYP